MDEYSILKAERDKFEEQEKYKKKSLEDGYLVGECLEMCSRFEFLLRVKQNDVHSYEMVRNN